MRLLKVTNVKIHNLVWTSLIYVFIYVQPSFVMMIMRLLSCRYISGKYYMTADVSFECYTVQFYAYLSLFIPLLLAFVVLVPGIMFYGLHRARKLNQLKLPSVRYKYGFLFNEVTKINHPFHNLGIIALYQL